MNDKPARANALFERLDYAPRDWAVLAVIASITGSFGVLGFSYVTGEGYAVFDAPTTVALIVAASILAGVLLVAADRGLSRIARRFSTEEDLASAPADPPEPAPARVSAAAEPAPARASRLARFLGAVTPRWAPRSIALFSLVMALFWLPWLIANYPGGTYWDTYYQIFQCYPENHPIAIIPFAECYDNTLTDAYFCDHHPLVDTLIYGAFGMISDALTGNWMAGVFAFVCLQGAASVIAFTAAVAYLRRRRCPLALCLAAYVYLCIMPFVSTWQLCMVKDSLFGLFYIPYLIMLFEAVRTRGASLESPRAVVLFALVGLMLCLTKKTGLYVVVPTALLALFMYASYRGGRPAGEGMFGLGSHFAPRLFLSRDPGAASADPAAESAEGAEDAEAESGGGAPRSPREQDAWSAQVVRAAHAAKPTGDGAFAACTSRPRQARAAYPALRADSSADVQDARHAEGVRAACVAEPAGEDAAAADLSRARHAACATEPRSARIAVRASRARHARPVEGGRHASAEPSHRTVRYPHLRDRRRHRHQHAAWRAYLAQLLLCVVVMCVLFPAVVFPLLNVAPGGKQEVYGTLFQQTARVVRDFPQDVTPRERYVIDEVLQYENLPYQYVFNFQDSVKYRYRLDADAGEMSDYLKVWLDQGIRHPEAYLASLFSLAGYYVAPTAPANIRMVTVDTHMGPAGEQRYMLWNPDELDPMRLGMDEMYKAVSGTPGLNFPLLLVVYVFWLPAALMFVSWRHRLRSAALLLPALILLAFCIIAPVYDARYCVPLLNAAPLMLCMMTVLLREKLCETKGKLPRA